MPLPDITIDASTSAAPQSAARDLATQIRTQPWLFQFKQAVHLLALDARNRGLPVRDGLPSKLRFRTPASLAFPPSELIGSEALPDIKTEEESETTAGAAEALALYVGFFGLTGPSGVLPTRYTELLIDRKNHYRDSTLHDFLDLFSHRAIALFYAATQKYRCFRQLELDSREGFSRNLLDLAGVGLGGLRDRLRLTRDPRDADRFLMYYAGVLSQRPISAASLEALVRGLLGVNVKLLPFQGTVLPLSKDQQSSLNRHNCRLGVDTLIGTHQYDCQTRVTLAIGPLTSKTFAELLPGGSAARALAQLVYFCVGHTLSIDVKLILQREAIPAPHLSAQAATPKQLGFNLWIRTQPIREDRDDAHYVLQT